MSGYVIQRNIMPRAKEILAFSPVTVISGGRQTGKSTLAQELVRDTDAVVANLDVEAYREAADADPDGFIRQFSDRPLVIDEIQRVPKLFLAIKAAVDADRRPGRFVVTGSSNFFSLSGTEESLAGRAITIPMRGLSQGELRGITDDFAAWAWKLPENPSPQLDLPELSRRDYLTTVVQSSFPEIHNAPAALAEAWLDAYVERVTNLDARLVRRVQHPDRLGRLLRLLAAEPAMEFVAAKAGRSLDVPARSIPAYLDTLRDVYLIDELDPWGRNLSSRVAGRKKVMFNDTAIASILTGTDVESLECDIAGQLTGGLVENFVATELAKQRAWSSVKFNIMHYRHRDGEEVDLILENRRHQIVAIEVKTTTTVRAQHVRNLRSVRDKVGDAFIAGIVLYTGTKILPFGDNIWAVPINALWETGEAHSPTEG